VLEFRQPSDALTATLLQYGGYKHSDASSAIAKEKEVSPVALAPSSSSSSITVKSFLYWDRGGRGIIDEELRFIT
jgi:hypothetical protein